MLGANVRKVSYRGPIWTQNGVSSNYPNTRPSDEQMDQVGYGNNSSSSSSSPPPGPDEFTNFARNAPYSESTQVK
jgi:hypothetical protein